jgi:succinate dehydrogenase flavin-adding protein (antitoxin of CptAB toxin-antitoxin module)
MNSEDQTGGAAAIESDCDDGRQLKRLKYRLRNGTEAYVEILFPMTENEFDEFTEKLGNTYMQICHPK